jgi:GntR family transcriptional regulator, galactonate operon transcriptional repressor
VNERNGRAQQPLRRGLHGRVVDELGMRIVGGAWSAGAPLPNEDELAAELGVSRTVVREAVKALQAKGLVEVRPKTGTRVRPRRAWHLLDADIVAWQFTDMERSEDLRELYEVRASIAAAAARLAALRRTDEQLAVIEAHQRRIVAAAAEPLARRAADLDFHAAVVDAAHNSLLAHVGAMVRVALDSAAAPAASLPDDEAGALRAAVIEAIRAGDGEAAEKAMRMLVDLAWEAIASARREEIR